MFYLKDCSKNYIIIVMTKVELMNSIVCFSIETMFIYIISIVLYLNAYLMINFVLVKLSLSKNRRE